MKKDVDCMWTHVVHLIRKNNEKSLDIIIDSYNEKEEKHLTTVANTDIELKINKITPQNEGHRIPYKKFPSHISKLIGMLKSHRLEYLLENNKVFTDIARITVDEEKDL
jgi:hypothetical protein